MLWSPLSPELRNRAKTLFLSGGAPVQQSLQDPASNQLRPSTEEQDSIVKRVQVMQVAVVKEMHVMRSHAALSL